MGVVLPALNDTLVKFSEANDGLLTASVTVTFEAGATARVTGKGTLAPGPTVTAAGTMIPC